MSNKLSRTTLIISLAILLTAIAAPVVAQNRRPETNDFSQKRRPETNAFSLQSSNESAITVFRAARDLITDGEWARAQTKWSEYVTKYPNEKNLDAALYWLAYSQYKLKHYDQCRETVGKLFTKYQNSTWLDDARLLMAQIPGAISTPSALSAQDELIAAARAAAPVSISRLADETVVYAPGAPLTTIGTTMPVPAQLAGTAAYVLGVDGLSSSENDDDPCEFKIVVLQALFESDLQRGIVAATDWLKPGSAQTARCKSAALTLLGRHGGKAVTPVILNLAKTETDVKLRARAISTLGATNDDSVIDALREFALNSTDNTIVEASLYALSRHTNDRVVSVLTDIATSGKTTAHRKAAIATIAIRPGDPAVDALLRLYDANQNVEIREAVISAFANRKSERAYNKLLEIARYADNVELRNAAINSVARGRGDRIIEFLLSIYETEKNEAVKDHILSALGGNTFLSPGLYEAAAQNGQFVASSRVNDQRVIKKLIEIARNTQEPMARRKRAIGWLSRSNDPQVQKFLEELLKQ